jgi:ribonuclease HI
VAWVRYNDGMSRPRTFTQGLPQGAVLSPLLFLIFINDLPSAVKKPTNLSLYADDVALWASNHVREEAERKLQEDVAAVAEWSETWKLDLSPEKCEVSVFSTSNADTNWQPIINVWAHRLNVTKDPVFLGLRYDGKLSFKNHATDVSKKVRARSNIIRALSGTDWGCDSKSLRTVYMACGRSVIEYGMAAYVPWLHKTNFNTLEKAQNDAARAYTGLTPSTPLDALRKEANIPSIRERSVVVCTKAYDKALRLPPDNPRHVTASQRCRQRLKRTDWRECSRQVWESIFGVPEGVVEGFVADWQRGSACEIRSIIRPREDGGQVILDTPTELTAYTDGSATEGTTNGGAGVIITKGGFTADDIVEQISAPAGKWSSSTQAEILAIKIAAKWLKENISSWQTVKICSDSQAAIMAINKKGMVEPLVHATNALLGEIITQKGNNEAVTLVWIPGHSGLEGNERADLLAKEGGTMSQEGLPCSHGSACAMLKLEAKRRNPMTHERSRRVYAFPIDYRREAALSKADQTLIKRMRTDHCPLLLNFKKKIDVTFEALCRVCETEEESTDHVIWRCSGVRDQRRAIFNGSVPDNALSNNPEQALELLRAFFTAVETAGSNADNNSDGGDDGSDNGVDGNVSNNNDNIASNNGADNARTNEALGGVVADNQTA